MFAGGHVDVNQFHSKPRHEDEEGQNRKDSANRCVVRWVILIGETYWLAKPIELPQEFVTFLLFKDCPNVTLSNCDHPGLENSMIEQFLVDGNSNMYNIKCF